MKLPKNRTQLIFIVVQLVFIAVAAYGVVARHSSAHHPDRLSKLQKQVMQFSVIPSLFFASVGHLFFGKQVRESQGWGNDTGTITLQREIGLMELVMALFSVHQDVTGKASVDESPVMGSLWGVILATLGFNHILINKKLTTMAILDIVYGFLLMLLFTY